MCSLANVVFVEQLGNERSEYYLDADGMRTASPGRSADWSHATSSSGSEIPGRPERASAVSVQLWTELFGLAR